MVAYESLPSGYSELHAEGFVENPGMLRHTLEARGALEFRPYPSGLFPASDLPPEVAEATGMGMAWLRDNAYVANALYETGRRELAIPVGRAMLTILNNNRPILDGVVNGVFDPRDVLHRLPVRVNGSTLENDREKRVQNDSVGHTLWFVGRLIAEGAITPSATDMDTIAQTVRYLDAIEFWQDQDEGHWEEDRSLHASSIGSVIAGLKGIQRAFEHVGYACEVPIAALVGRGIQQLHALLPYESPQLPPSAPIPRFYPDTIFPDEAVDRYFGSYRPNERTYDAALLFLVEPLQVVGGEQADRIVMNTTDHLLRKRGIARYEGDTYWEPRFPHILGIEERTAAAEGRLESRNRLAPGIGYSGTEAQWTLFDPLLSVYWGKRFADSNSQGHRRLQLLYLNRSLSQLAESRDGRLLMPEAYYHEYEDGAAFWKPNDHSPLLWSQANLLLALETFESTTAG